MSFDDHFGNHLPTKHLWNERGASVGAFRRKLKHHRNFRDTFWRLQFRLGENKTRNEAKHR